MSQAQCEVDCGEFISKDVLSIFKKFPKIIDGKNAILEMKDGNSKNWKQMEWMGFYFEYWCNENLKDFMEMPYAKKYGHVSFDGFLRKPWDFKCHATESGNIVPINDYEAISKAVNEFGYVGIILAECSVHYDNESLDFKTWHDTLKGRISNYEQNRIKRNAPSRKRKTRINLSKINFIRFDNELLVKCKSFQKNFRNANGIARREKISLDLSKIKDHIEHVIYFS
jgi:hypothetical protein